MYPYPNCSCCMCRYASSRLPPEDTRYAPFTPLPPGECNCLHCTLARDKTANPTAYANTNTNTNSPSALNPLLMPLSPAWLDAIAGAITLGMTARTANRTASTLAQQFPNASHSQALALILQNA